MNGAAASTTLNGSSTRQPEDLSDSYDERAAKRLHRTTIGSDNSWRPFPSASPASQPTTATTLAARRQSGMKELHKPLHGPRPPDFSASKRVTSDSMATQQSPTRHSFLPSSNTTSEPFLGLSRRMTSNFDFGLPGGNTQLHPPEPNKLYKRPSAEISLSSMPSAEYIPAPNTGHSINGSTYSKPPTTLPNAPPYQNPSSSSLRGPPSKQRNPALRAAQLSTASASGSTISTPLTIRTRRQSQLPPSAQNRVDARQTRQSVGPGYLAATWTTEPANRASQFSAPNLPINDSTSIEKVRPTAAGQATAARKGALSSRVTSNGGAVNTPDSSTSLKSVQPSEQFLNWQQPTYSSNISSANETGSESEQIGATKMRIRRVDAATPASARHKLGLARTVSPTDAKKSKRVSAMPPPIPTPTRSPSIEAKPGHRKRRSTPSPEPLPDPGARFSKLPPTPPLPRQSPPSSFGTTFSETNQSVAAGRSLSSRSSSTSLRPPSSGVSNPASSSSTTPKQSGTKAKLAEKLKLEGLELVPPVPAIPKAYESPNYSTDEPFFSASESIGAQSGTEAPAANAQSANADRTSPIKKQPRSRRRFTLGAKIDTDKDLDNYSSDRQGKQQANLPPLTLLSLGKPTSDKIASITQKATQPTSGKVTPSRPVTAKTPTTPMTASRATFSTSGYQNTVSKDTTTAVRPSTSGIQSSTGLPFFQDSDKPSPTPYLTPSPPPETVTNATKMAALTPVPSNSTGLGQAQEVDAKSDTQSDFRASRLAGFRSRAFSRSSKDPTPSQASGTAYPDNNRSTPTGKRRLTLVGWRRSSSKASHFHPNEEVPDVNLLPPKLPAPILPSESLAKELGYPEQLQTEPTKATGVTKPLNSSTKPETLRPNDKNATEIASDSSLKRLSASEKTSSLRSPMQRLMGHKPTQAPPKPQSVQSSVPVESSLAEEEMKKLASKKKEFESAARSLDQLQQRASPKERVSPAQASQAVNLNIFERGEIIDYPDVFFCGLKDAKKCVGDLASQLSNFGFDDERGDYNIVVGDHLAYRYEVVDVLGKGSFGQVVRCIDHKHGKLVAVKIIRNKKRFHQQALVEVNLLQKLREWDLSKKHSNVEFTQSFYFRGHLCIATELLGMNLYEFIKAHDFHGFSLKLIRRFTQQMLASLCLLQNHNVIHCDLKPENILLVHPLHSEIKVIDFGSSCFENEKVYTYIQSRFYRSPEVILGMDYGMPIDMWSLGCILAELLTGYPIFPGENEQEQLACIMEIFGPPEKHLIERSSRKKLFFDSLGKPRVTVSSKGKRRRPSSKTLQQALKCDDDAFLDFITQCLRWDPERRLKPNAALSHDFVMGVKNSKGKMQMSSGTSSPAKRPATSVQTPAKLVRPLPDVPATAHKAGTAVTNSIGPSNSPLKSAIPPRRYSTMAGIQTGAAGTKRGPNGAVLNSALPRSISGKPDLASAAAIASLQRQR